ncbi:MAG TPA: hypothetical protein VFP84_08010 [Kofleriaceae bacterium]|nr:hypothetical protein [Kofleriaceae bacterium]
MGKWSASFVLGVAGICFTALAADSPHAVAEPATSGAKLPENDPGPADPDRVNGDAARAARVAPVVPDPPARTPPVVPPSGLPTTADLDGLYVWLGPVGAASHIAGQWDSTFGGDIAVVAVHEHARLAAAGVTLGASKWTARGGGRVWVDGLAGTHLLDHMVGVSLGPIVELADLAHARIGGSIGVWGFAGITPYARLGAVTELGMFAEVGIHIALPAIRR